MSKIDVQNIRTDDHRIMFVNFDLDYDAEFEYATIIFQCNGESLRIVSSTVGSINEEGHIKTKIKKGQCYLEYCDSGRLDCLVGYYSKNDLQYNEILSVSVEKTEQIIDSSINIRTIGSRSRSFEKKYTTFLSSLNDQPSSWLLDISFVEDVFIRILAKGQQPTLVSFGENSTELLGSDFIFVLYPETSKLNIPKEILAKQYTKYPIGCKLGVFELVKPDFLNLENLYYKVPISNTMTLNDIAIK